MWWRKSIYQCLDNTDIIQMHRKHFNCHSGNQNDSRFKMAVFDLGIMSISLTWEYSHGKSYWVATMKTNFIIQDDYIWPWNYIKVTDKTSHSRLFKTHQLVNFEVDIFTGRILIIAKKRQTISKCELMNNLIWESLLDGLTV